jgi:hypothetical protein
LAVHLDGDLALEAFDREAYEPLGYGFVCDDSLHTHLRECATCQTALQRARRLDAALATMAGRAVADQAAISGCSLEQLSEQWLNCAALAAAGQAPVAADAARASQQVAACDSRSTEHQRADPCKPQRHERRRRVDASPSFVNKTRS